MQEIVNNLDIELLFEKHTLFRGIAEKFGNPPNWQREQGFVSLSQIILEQQVSLESAKAHFNKLNAYLPEFSPDAILKLSDEEFRRCQISRQKTSYLRALSMAIVDGSLALSQLEMLTDFEVREQLLTIKGIGNWTADIYLMFCLQRKDIFPAGDIAVISAAKELLQHDQKDAVLLASENWRPVRSLAAYFFWHFYLRSRNR